MADAPSITLKFPLDSKSLSENDGGEEKILLLFQLSFIKVVHNLRNCSLVQ